jgi:hypothetical protein
VALNFFFYTYFFFCIIRIGHGTCSIWDGVTLVLWLLVICLDIKAQPNFFFYTYAYIWRLKLGRGVNTMPLVGSLSWFGVWSLGIELMRSALPLVGLLHATWCLDL